MNWSVQGDVVVVEVFDEKEWKTLAEAVVDQECMFYLSQFEENGALNTFAVTLRNDDPEDSEEEADDDPALAEDRERQLLDCEHAQKWSPWEKQPTGCIVGIIKRNWHM